jgi:hypothetical protein
MSYVDAYLHGYLVSILYSALWPAAPESWLSGSPVGSTMVFATSLRCGIESLAPSSSYVEHRVGLGFRELYRVR